MPDAKPPDIYMSPFLSGCLDTLHEGGVGLDSATALCSKLAALKASPLESLEEEPSHFASFDKPEDWMNLSVALCCMLMAATASGLTMGVVSLDELELRVKERNVNESKTERGCASGATCREAAPQTAADAATLHGPARTGGLAGERPTTSQVRDADSAADPAVASAPAAGVAAAAERDRKRGDAALSGQAGPSLGRHPHLRHRGPLRWRDHPRRGLYRPCQDEERLRPLSSLGPPHDDSLLTQPLLRSSIAALLSPLAWFIVMLSSPISYPLGWALRRPLPTRTARNLPRHFPAPGTFP